MKTTDDAGNPSVTTQSDN